MRSDDIEKALRAILGASSEAEGLVVTLRRHDEYESLIERIHALEKTNDNLLGQIRSMSEYANLYLVALDELKFCRDTLAGLGIDTGFITCLRPR